MTREQLIAEKVALKSEYNLLRKQITSVTTQNGFQNIQLEIQKIDTKMNLIDKELELVQLEESLAQEKQENL